MKSESPRGLFGPGLLSLLLLSLALSLTGCRSRLIPSPPQNAARDTEGAPDTPSSARETGEESREENTPFQGEADPEEGTRENPEAERKEYDENAAVELTEGTGRDLHAPGEGAGAFALAEGAGRSVYRLDEKAEETARQTVSAEAAEQMGVSADAPAAESAMTYYTVLLSDRLKSLYECKRQTVYLETPQDHVTVFKTSQEHEWLLSAGVYDASSRLLAENLRVDDGWIERKNPDVIVKLVPSSILGAGAVSSAPARAAYAALLSRPGWANLQAVRGGRVLLLSGDMLNTPCLKTAAALLLAKAAYPDLFADTDAAAALAALAEEAAGAPLSGIWYWDGTNHGNE